MDKVTLLNKKVHRQSLVSDAIFQLEKLNDPKFDKVIVSLSKRFYKMQAKIEMLFLA